MLFKYKQLLQFKVTSFIREFKLTVEINVKEILNVSILVRLSTSTELIGVLLIFTVFN